MDVFYRFEKTSQLFFLILHVIANFKHILVVFSCINYACVQMHGNKPEHWILAAKWEIESCKSIDNGRIIFMKGIKRHPDSKKLWLEFFRAELMFAEKLRRRMKLLTPETMDPCELVDFFVRHNSTTRAKYRYCPHMWFKF